MIIITGATGALNGATVNHLLNRIPASRIGISVRKVDQAKHYADRGIRVRYGSYDDSGALRDSFADAEQVLIVSSSDYGVDVVSQHRRAIEAAVDAGAKHVLYTSTTGAAADCPYAPLAIHAATEDILAASGVAWTALRNGFYGNLNLFLGSWQQSGVIEMPADGPIPWVDRNDAAEAAAEILARGRAYNGPVDLSPSDPVTLADFARFATDLSGKLIKRVVVEDEQWVENQVAKGVPEAVAQFTLNLLQASRTGYFAQGGKTLLGDLLGRKARSAAMQLSDCVSEARS